MGRRDLGTWKNRINKLIVGALLFLVFISGCTNEPIGKPPAQSEKPLEEGFETVNYSDIYSNLPEIENLDVEIQKSLVAMEATGSEFERYKFSYYNLYKKVLTGKGETTDWEEIEKLEEIRFSSLSQYWHWNRVHKDLRALRNYYNSSVRALIKNSFNEKYPNPEESLKRIHNTYEVISLQILEKEIEQEWLVEKGKKGVDVYEEFERLESEIENLGRIYLDSRFKYQNLRRDFLFFSGVEYPPEFWPGESREFDYPIENGVHFFSEFTSEKVWIGLYNTTEPGTDNYIGEFCEDTFETNLNYYWQKANEFDSSVQSIRIRWYYTASDSDGRRHNLIWEGRTNRAGVNWYTFAEFNDAVLKEGNYGVVSIDVRHPPILDICTSKSELKWCNIQCGECFACDSDKSQHYVRAMEG